MKGVNRATDIGALFRKNNTAREQTLSQIRESEVSQDGPVNKTGQTMDAEL